MTQEQIKKIKSLNDRFNALQVQLLLKREYELVDELSKVYFEVQK